MRSSTGETAAERRRREALQRPTEEDSDDDGTERVPPTGRAGSSGQDRERSENVETAAERRRREGALGHSHEAESSSEDEDSPRQPPRRENVRFADQASPQGRQPRQTALRWGKDRGR